MVSISERFSNHILPCFSTTDLTYSKTFLVIRKAYLILKYISISVAEAAARKSELSKLLGAVKAANLAETLSSGGPFTVFAPRNAAFFKISSNQLDNLHFI